VLSRFGRTAAMNARRWPRRATPARTTAMCLSARRRGRESGERARAGAKAIDVDAQAVQHAQIEIAERRWVGRVEGQVLAVAETAACQYHRQGAGGVAAGIAPGAAEEHHRPVEEGLALFSEFRTAGQGR